MKIELVIPGEPVPKGRPRINRKTGTVYTPKRTKDYEEFIKWKLISEYKEIPKMDEIVATVRFYLSIPKSASKKRKERMSKDIERPTKTPDIDNLFKSVLDGLNKLAFEDDKQIVEAHLYKHWSKTPRTEIKLEERKLPIEH